MPWVLSSLVSIMMVVTALKPMAEITPARTKLTLEFPLTLEMAKVSMNATTAKTNAKSGVPTYAPPEMTDARNTM